MIELYNALKFITMLFFIQKILRFNLDVAFLKSVSIYCIRKCFVLAFKKSTELTKNQCCKHNLIFCSFQRNKTYKERIINDPVIACKR